MSPRSHTGTAEELRLREIIDQLRSEGWAVITEPSNQNLPDALLARQVDFIARRGTELLIGEVASRSSAKEERIDLLARQVEKIPNAQLQVYWLGDSPTTKPDFHQVQRYIDEATAIAEISRQGGLLMALAALEGAVASFAERAGVKPETPPRQLLSNLYSLGLVDEPDFDRVSSLYKLRSEIAHQTTPQKPTPGDISFALNLADQMLQDRYVSADRMAEWLVDWREYLVRLSPGASDAEEMLREVFRHASDKTINDVAHDFNEHSEAWTQNRPRGQFVTPVPWVTTPPDLIEQTVAVLLGHLNPQAVRIRPSQGDRGLDVVVPGDKPGYVDVYQVKRFAAGLNSSQKRQIRKSLTRALETHNDPSSRFMIETWLLTLPLDPTPEQLQWLADEAAELKVPFKVEWKGYSFLEGLAADYPQVIDYYLRDGKDRLDETIAALRDLAQLPASTTGAAIEPKDVARRLGGLFQALNREDPHYRYDFEVTANPPILFERPYLVASVAEGRPGQYITFHVYARYVNATEDRPIPIAFEVSREHLTPEALNAVNEMLRYGTPAEVPASAITNLHIDMPAGLGITDATGSIYLGPARSDSDQPSRVTWSIISEDGVEPPAQLTFVMEAATRGELGGLLVRGTDTTGVVAVTIRVDPPQDENPTMSLSLTLINPVGKPVRQALPGLRFLRQFKTPNRLGFGPEYGPLAVAEVIRLPSGQQAIPASVLDYAEALDTIGRRSGLAVTLPDFAALTEDDYRAVIGAAKVLRGERTRLTWSSITARVRPGVIEPSQAAVARPMMTEQDLIVNIAGTEHSIGRAFTYLLSARIDGDLNVEPGPDGNIEVTIVPGDNDEAIMTTEDLTLEAIQDFAVES